MENPQTARNIAKSEGAEAFGALVGWTSESLGDRMILKLESVRSAQPRSHGEVQNFSYFLTRSQAAVLANYLYEISEQTPPRPRRRGWLGKLLRN